MGEFVDITYTRVLPYPVDVAYAWLTDYRDDDHTRTDRVLARRTVAERAPDRVLMDVELDIVGRTKARAEVRLFPPDRWEARPIGRHGPSKTVYTYQLEPAPGGSRLTVVYHTRVRNPVRRTVARLMLPVLRARIARMWDGFAAAMAKDLGATPRSAPEQAP